MKPVFSIQVSSFAPENPDFFHFQDVELIHSAAGDYLEAGREPLSRFGWRIPIENPGKPHLLRVVYPDDRRRFMTVGDGSCYDASFGIVTGFRWPVSGKMQTAELYFWPRYRDFSLCFMTWGKDEPAAIAGFEVFELSGEEMAPVAPQFPGGRRFGIHYEDPCGTQAAEGAYSFEEWMDHLFTYLHFTGQDTLCYPICWYHGPLFPGTSEGGEYLGISVENDRKQYIVWSDTPSDWPAVLLDRCKKEKVSFWGGFTLLRLKSLMEKLTASPELLNALDNDMLQTGTMDWTVVYHSLNYPEMLVSDDPFNTAAPRKLAYGEKSRIPGCPVGPIFNPLHPEVQSVIIRFFRECCQLYGKYSSFKGISVNLWAPTLLWFGSLRSGYDDYTVGLFESENNCRIPADSSSPNRFSARAAWLLENCREEWIRWRCLKVASLIRQIRDEMKSVRQDLVLSLVMWNEPYVPAICPVGTEAAQYGTRENCISLYRNGGFDPELFRDEPNMELVFQTDGGNRDRTPSNHTQDPAAFYMFRDFDYLDDSCWKVLRQADSAGVFVFNSWHEAWGKHLWFPAEDGLAPKSMFGSLSQNFFRINSWYEPDGFWFDSQLRITPAAPPGRLYLEHFAHAVAKGDVGKITAGGLFIDKLHAELFREFTDVFCRIPDQHFEDAGSSGDPVTVRQLRMEDGYCVYAVNREPYEVKIRWSSPVLLQGKSVNGKEDFNHAETVLKPFELQAWHLNGPVEDFCCTIPEEVAGKLIAEAGKALTKNLPENIISDLKIAIKERYYSRLRHLLSSYPVSGK